MNDDKKLDALEKQLVPSPELITDGEIAENPDVTEKMVEAMDK